MKKIGLLMVVLLVLIFPLQLVGQSTQFFIDLANKEYASVADGLQMIAYLADLDGAILQGGSSAILAELQSRGIVEEEEVQINEELTKGFLANMIMKTLDLGGGMWYSITGADRYAYRELVFKGIITSVGSEYQGMSGGELIAIISRASLLKEAEEAIELTIE